MVVACYFLALFVILLTASAVLRNRKDFKATMRFLILSVLIVVAILIYPAYRANYDVLSSVIFALLYALRTLFGRQSGELAQTIEMANWLYHPFYITLYSVFVVAPVLTTGFLLSILGNISDQIRYFFLAGKRIHVFSDLNEGALLLAESVNSPDARFVFCNSGTEPHEIDNHTRWRVRSIGGMILQKKSTTLSIRKSKKYISFYQISEKKDSNLSDALLLIENYRDRQNAEINIMLFSSGRTTELLLDSVDKGGIRVKLIDEIKFTCYNLLDTTPLFKGVTGNKISALVIGGGHTGLEMVKAIVWCGQLKNIGLNINVIDKHASGIEKILKRDCPELSSGEYNIRFLNADVQTTDFTEVLDEYCRETTYVVVSLPDDKLNIDTALYLRKYFLRRDRKNFTNHPQINLRVRDSLRGAEIDSLRDTKIEGYGLNAFGSMRKVFNKDNLLNSLLEEMAKNVHLAHHNALTASPQAQEAALQAYYAREYNQRSSLACALHFKYKLFSCGLVGLSGATLGEHLVAEAKQLLANPNHLLEIAQMEHSRWKAFIRSEGFCKAETEDVCNYYNPKRNPSHMHHIAKLHPALVDWEDLEKVSKELSEICGLCFDFKKDDIELVKKMPEIIRVSIEALRVRSKL